MLEDFCPTCNSEIRKSYDNDLVNDWQITIEWCKCGTFTYKECTCWACARAYVVDKDPDSLKEGEVLQPCRKPPRHEFPN